MRSQPKVFSDLLKKAQNARIIPNKNQAARDWFKVMSMNVRRVDEKDLFKGKDRLIPPSSMMPGQMLIYQYDAKTKDKLPYWDACPLIFPFRKVKGGFYGINLHYLPPALRAKLFDALVENTNNTSFDETTRIQISYKLLNSAAKYKYFKPCVKRYLYSQMQSKCFLVHPEEWSIALFLPLARWQKASATEVYKGSREIIG